MLRSPPASESRITIFDHLKADAGKTSADSEIGFDSPSKFKIKSVKSLDNIKIGNPSAKCERNANKGRTGSIIMEEQQELTQKAAGIKIHSRMVRKYHQSPKPDW